MHTHAMIARFVLVFTLALTLWLTPTAEARDWYDYPEDLILIRRTLPASNARLAPLTSDQLNTASTRLVDARRGFRSFESVFNGRARSHRRVIVGFDDHFGISRPEDRPFSFSQRTPRTFVTQFRGQTRVPGESVRRPAGVGRIIVGQNVSPLEVHAPELNLRVHSDRSVVPKTSGAVLITSDGTVIQIGN